NTHSLINRNGQRNPHEATALRNDLGIDAYHLPREIDKRTAGITRIDGNVCLDEWQIVASIAIDRADNARGGRRIKARWRANGQYPLPFLELGGVANRQWS